MDIHKPKAAHSWREFLIEIGTIICGILIALGLEQAVEVVHRAEEVREAREALMREVGEDTQRLKLSMQEDRCILQQLGAYAAWANGGPKPPPFRYFMLFVRRNTWETVKTGAASHMPLEERVGFAGFYDQVDNQLKNNALQESFHWPLMAFQGLQTLRPDERDNLLKIVAEEQQATYRVIGITANVVDRARELKAPERGGPAIERARAGVAWVCDSSAPDPFANGQ